MEDGGVPERHWMAEQWGAIPAAIDCFESCGALLSRADEGQLLRDVLDAAPDPIGNRTKVGFKVHCCRTHTPRTWPDV